jgi:hypothetical protein
MKAISNAAKYLLKAHGEESSAGGFLNVKLFKYLSDVLEFQENKNKRFKVSIVTVFADRFRDYFLR